MPEIPLLFATESDTMVRLAQAIGAEFLPLPSARDPDVFESWRASASQGTARERIVVAPWLDAVARAELMCIDATHWRQRFELPYLLWNFALGAASRRCADGGAIIAVTQTPPALDAAGWTPECAIADGVLALVRSVAAAEAARGVRANLVTTSFGLVEDERDAPTLPLVDFTGTLEGQVVGVIRTLLSPDAVGLNGRVLSTDGGRS